MRLIDKIKCPKCGCIKQKEYEKGAIGEIHSHGKNELGSYGETSKTCAQCNESYTLFTQFFSNSDKTDTYIKFDVISECDESGYREIDYKRMEITK